MSSRNISMRRREFACARLSSPYMTRSQPRLFHNVHHRDLATEAAYGCLKPPPAGRLRRAHLHLPYSMALACLHDTRPWEFSGSRIGGVYFSADLRQVQAEARPISVRGASRMRHALEG